jgi:hypothetical protein
MSYRKLFCLFWVSNLVELWNTNKSFMFLSGYTLIHAHSFPNDEPPYIMVKYWGMGEVRNVYTEDGESVSYYLIRTEDAQSFIDQQNEYQKEYEDCYLEGIMTRNCGEHSLSPRQYADNCDWNREPKSKYFMELPIKLQTMISN